MEKEGLVFIAEISKRIAKAYKDFRNWPCSIDITHHESKDYWTIDMEFNSGNSKYSDCVVFYLDEDFDPNNVLSDFDEKYEKALYILK